MLSYIVRQDDKQIGRRHATLNKARQAAIRASKRNGGDATVWWIDDTGKPKVVLGRAHGQTFESFLPR